jgi:DNA-binding transcriptional MerR regulator
MPAGKEGMREVAERIIAAVDNDPHPPGDRFERQRLQTARAAAERLLVLADLVPYDWITAQWENSIESTIDPIAETLDAYVKAEEPAAVPVSWQNLTEFWAVLGLFLPAVPGLLGEDLAREATAYRNYAEAEVERLRTKALGVEKEIEGIAARLDELDQARAEALAQLHARKTETEATVAEHVARLDAAIRQNQDRSLVRRTSIDGSSPIWLRRFARSCARMQTRCARKRGRISQRLKRARTRCSRTWKA